MLSASVGFAVAVDLGLEVTEQPGGVLHLVHEQRGWMTAQEGLWVLLGKPGFRGQVKADVVVVGKQAGQQGCFAGLASAGDYNGGKVPGKSQH